MAAGTSDTELQVEQVVLRIHPAPEAPHSATADFDLGPPQAGAGDAEGAVVDHGPVHVPHRHPLRARRLQPHGHPHHLPPGRPCPGHGAVQVIAHLQGREQALEPFGWTGRQAEWIALACLHSGVFTRAQLSAYLRIDRWQALRFVRAMSERRLAADETLEGRKVCRICGRGIYRALGAEDIRHRRTASADVLMRRLLSLDYVIEHTGLSWLPTELEKVGAFEALGIERRLLPSRLYRGAVGNTRRYFPLTRSASGRAGMCTPMPPSAGGSLVSSILECARLICRTGSRGGPDCWVPAEASVASRSGCPTGTVVGPRGRMAVRGRSGVLVATVLPYVLNGYMSIEARTTSTGEGKNNEHHPPHHRDRHLQGLARRLRRTRGESSPVLPTTAPASGS